MKKPLPLLAFALVAACSEKPKSEVVSTIEEPKNILENLTYTVDTLMVDTGNEILDFSLGYSTSPSPDGRFFYFFKNLKIKKL